MSLNIKNDVISWGRRMSKSRNVGLKQVACYKMIIFLVIIIFSPLNPQGSLTYSFENLHNYTDNILAIPIVSRVSPKIIDLNKETDFPHHNVTIFGSSEVVISGDIDGDKIDDIIISLGSHDGPNGTRTNCGAVVVKYGAKTQKPYYYLDTEYDLIIYGSEAYDMIGQSLAIGDVNDDGYNDILIGAIYGRCDLNAKVMGGEVYVIYGNKSLPKIWDLKTTPADVTIYGVDAYDRLGGALTSGDINNDGFDDIIMSATYAKGPNNTRTYSSWGCGEVYIIFGNKSLLPLIDLVSRVDLHIYGADARDFFGCSLATCDINCDNTTDLVIGAYWGGGYKNAIGGGEVYVIYGNSSFSSTIDLLYETTDMIIYGADASDSFGSKLACGDLNGDGIKDLAISAPNSRGANNSQFLYCGEVWVLFGNKTNLPVINSSDVDVIIYGKHGNDTMGIGLSIGKINNDNYADLIIGAPGADGYSSYYRDGCGQVYVFNGRSTWFKKKDLRFESPDTTIYGADGYIQYVSSADSAGKTIMMSDINGDDIDEILIHSSGKGRNNEGVTSGELSIILSGGEIVPIPVIESVRLLNGAGDDDQTCYADYSFPYIFQVMVTTPNNLNDFDSVTITLAYLWPSMKYQYTWDRSTGEFFEVWDPYERVKLSNKSSFKNNGDKLWTVNFYIIFDVDFPDNLYHKIAVNTRFNNVYFDQLNLTKDMFMVENRFDFAGNLVVESEYLGLITEDSWIRGNEILTWTGLKVVYYESDDVYPPTYLEIIVTVWDNEGNNWSWQNIQNEDIYIQTVALNVTKEKITYNINISNFDWWRDRTNVKFKLNIENNLVEFYNQFPQAEVWQSTLRPACGLQLSDPTTNISQSSVQYQTSIDDGVSWSNWTSQGIQYEFYNKTLNCTVIPFLKDGVKNLIQWRGRDIVGNPYNESDIYRIRVDVSTVTFQRPLPTAYEIQRSLNVTCGIMVVDIYSGVDASTIEFSTSISGIWDYGDWQPARKTMSGNMINCSVTPTFVQGANNYIRWRAKDMVGNEFNISDNYQITVQLNTAPETKLLAPANRSILKILTPELAWTSFDLDNDTDLYYDIYLSENLTDILKLNQSAIVDRVINDTSLRINIPLDDEKVYYWTVIPDDGIDNGTCTSGYFRFKIDTKIEIPLVRLLTPPDKTDVSTNTPKLVWELSYSEPDKVTFDIFYRQSTNPNFEFSNNDIYKKDYKLTTFIFDKPLTPGETYYWTVIPHVTLLEGELGGICSSGIWSFNIELPQENLYALDLGIEFQHFKIDQGNYSLNNITVINLGNTIDTIFVYVDKGVLDANVALEHTGTPIKLNRSEVIRLRIEILVSETAKPQNYTISVTAMSNGAALERKDVTVTKSFKIQVIEKKKTPVDVEDVGEGEKGEEVDYLVWSVLIIIIILIVSLFIFIYYSRRIPYVKSELLSEPPEHLVLPGISGKPSEISALLGTDTQTSTELRAATTVKGAITLEGRTIPAEFQLPKAVLTKDQELKLLREKFLMGEISEDMYRELKAEIQESKDITKDVDDDEMEDEVLQESLPEDLVEPELEQEEPLHIVDIETEEDEPLSLEQELSELDDMDNHEDAVVDDLKKSADESENSIKIERKIDSDVKKDKKDVRASKKQKIKKVLKKMKT